MNKNYKMMLFALMATGTFMSISSQSWLGMWMGLEINLIAFTPIMQEKKNNISIESSIKYFITQTMASMILIASLIQMSKELNPLSPLKTPHLIMFNSALLTKMGMAPFHFWFPEVMEGLNWMNCAILMTWQKLAPMVMLMYNPTMTMMMQAFIMTGLMISGIMSFNQTSLRKLMSFSSINHMSWMMSSMLTNQLTWLIYFMTYSLMTMNISWTMFNNNLSSTNQMIMNLNNNPQMKMLFSLNFLNLSGIPPFLGFIPKWMIIESINFNNMNLLATTMVISTMMMMFVYTKIMALSTMMYSTTIKWSTNSIKTKSILMSTMNFITIYSLLTLTLLINMT